MCRRALLGALLGLTACADPGPGPELAPVGRRQHAIRPTEGARNPLWHYDEGDEVEHHDTDAGHFRIHFTRLGRHRVPAADADADGLPDYVREVGEIYEEVLAFYTGRGFRAPLDDARLGGDNGGDERFDVYLLDFANSSDGSFGLDACVAEDDSHCLGHIVQENDYAGYGYPNRTFAARVLASHEFFHAIQAAYDSDQDVIVSEGTAVWASQAFDPRLHELESFAGGYLRDPGRSIDVPPGGPVPSFAYGAGLFFQFLEERFDADLIRSLWEHVEDGHGLPGGADSTADPHWLDQIALLVLAEHDTPFAEALVDLARWNLFTGSRADPERGYAGGARYPAVAMETVEAPFVDERVRFFYAAAQYFQTRPGARQAMTAALVPAAERPDDLTDLVLLVAVDRQNEWTVIERAADPGAGPVVDTAGATHFVAVVVNTAIAGESRRPGLCIGTPDEVESCRRTLTGAPELDAAVEDAGVEGSADAEPPADALAPDADPAVADDAGRGDAASPDGGPDADGPATGGGGCSLTGPTAPAGPLALLCLLLTGLGFPRRGALSVRDHRGAGTRRGPLEPAQQ